jgi:hypothetical protein
MVNRRGAHLLDGVQHMTEGAQVAADKVHVVRDLAHLFADRIPAEDHGTLLAVCHQ